LGGTGKDIFDFNETSESGTNEETADFIADFSKFNDRLDLSGIDARALTNANDAFQFIGQTAFSAPGQVRVYISGFDTIVEVNTNGNSGAEMVIVVNGKWTLAAADFIL
jgi:Ca2+-binding RTX toxin-like protein